MKMEHDSCIDAMCLMLKRIDSAESLVKTVYHQLKHMKDCKSKEEMNNLVEALIDYMQKQAKKS